MLIWEAPSCIALPMKHEACPRNAHPSIWICGELEITRGDVDAQLSAGHANDTKSPIKPNRGIPVSFRPPNQSAGCCL